MDNPPDDEKDGQSQSGQETEAIPENIEDTSTLTESTEVDPLLRSGQVPYQTGFGQKPVEQYLISQRSDETSAVNAINDSDDHWYKHIRTWGIILIVLFLCLILVNPGGMLSKSSTSVSNTHETATTSPPKVSKFDMQTLVGMKWDEASRVLSDHNLTSADYRLKTEDGKEPDTGSDWIVISVSDQAKPLISLMHIAEKETTGQTSQNPDSEIPEDYKSALAQAKEYSEDLHLSQRGIYETLMYEDEKQYSSQAAQYAIDHLQVDYRKNALAKAREYQENLKMSPEEIHEQLISEAEMFTSEEADYAIQHLND